MTNSLFADLIEIGRGNEAIADARIKEFSDFSDDLHFTKLRKIEGLCARHRSPRRFMERVGSLLQLSSKSGSTRNEISD